MEGPFGDPSEEFDLGKMGRLADRAEGLLSSCASGRGVRVQRAGGLRAGCGKSRASAPGSNSGMDKADVKYIIGALPDSRFRIQARQRQDHYQT
jgi:hypothetical protein